MQKNEKEDYSYEKDQEISCCTVSSNNVIGNGSYSICSNTNYLQVYKS